jgi:hypothetical protein
MSYLKLSCYDIEIYLQSGQSSGALLTKIFCTGASLLQCMSYDLIDKALIACRPATETYLPRRHAFLTWHRFLHRICAAELRGNALACRKHLVTLETVQAETSGVARSSVPRREPQPPGRGRVTLLQVH